MIWDIILYVGKNVFDSFIRGMGDAAGESLIQRVLGSSNQPLPQDQTTALALRDNQAALKQLANAKADLAQVQRQSLALKAQEMSLTVQVQGSRLAQEREIAAAKLALRREEMALKVTLTEVIIQAKQNLQATELAAQQQAQKVQIQADWDEQKLPTIFSRQELQNLTVDCPLFVCAKMQVSEGCPDYFRTELPGELESQMRVFANQALGKQVQFYSRFFANENVFDTNATQLKTIIPQAPCVMVYSKMTQQQVYFHYQLWGSASADLLGGCFDLELPWAEVMRQAHQEMKTTGTAPSAEAWEECYGMVCDWVIALQKVVGCYLLDLYALVDGPNPYCGLSLERDDWGLPLEVVAVSVEPLREELRALQQERIAAFEAELARQQQQVEAERLRREEAERRQREKTERLPQAEARYPQLAKYLKNGQWKAADYETYRIMITTVGKEERDWFTSDELLNFPCEELLAIDYLWVKHSRGQFGFSVQKEIYIQCGGVPDGTYDKKVYEKFGDAVGWRENDEWLWYSELKFDTSSPSGHLPGGAGRGQFASIDVYRRGGAENFSTWQPAWIVYGCMYGFLSHRAL